MSLRRQSRLLNLRRSKQTVKQVVKQVQNDETTLELFFVSLSKTTSETKHWNNTETAGCDIP